MDWASKVAAVQRWFQLWSAPEIRPPALSVAERDGGTIDSNLEGVMCMYRHSFEILQHANRVIEGWI